MAHTHLASGRDVVMPQYLGRRSEIARFEKVAGSTGAKFLEFILMDSKERSIQRFTGRGTDDTLAWEQQVRDIVERTGGTALLARCTTSSTRSSERGRMLDSCQASPEPSG